MVDHYYKGAVQQLCNAFLRDFSPLLPLRNAVLTTVRNASLNPPRPSRRYVIVERPQM